MNNFLRKNKLEELLINLQTNKVESSNVDGKSRLNLKELGDRATLIRHVCAIANTGEEGYIIIGVEDKTWKPVGIPADSSLLDSDQTQKQINQILTDRVDPTISVSYRTYNYNDVELGVVLIPAGRPPYVISLSDSQYGGKRSDSAKESFVFRGVIYIRRGGESIIANHQSDLLGVLEGRINIVALLGSLGLIALIVSVGVGVGTSLITFADVYLPSVLGGSWGLIIGLLLNNRVIEAVGKFPKNIFSGLLRSSFGPFFGIAVGAWLSFTLVNFMQNGKIKALDPLSMGLVVVPVLLVINFLPAVIAWFAIEYLPITRWIGNMINYFLKWRGKRSRTG